MSGILTEGKGLYCTAERGVQGRRKTLCHTRRKMLCNTVIPDVGKQKAATTWYFQYQHTAQQFRTCSAV